MNFQRSTLMLTAGAFLLVVAVFLALRLAGTLSSPEEVPALAASKSDVERIVRNYLLEHPEVIFEAVEKYQQSESDTRVSQMRDKGKKRAAELFDAPDALVVGNPKGDVTIVEFFDYRCGYCRKVVKDVASLIKQDGNIRLVMKEFPILSVESEMAARAAVASAEQGKYWEFHLALMEAEELSEPSIMFAAKSVGLDVVRLKADMNSAKVKKAIDATHALARDLGIDSTPTFFVGNEPFAGAKPLSELKEAVQAARKAKQS
jgi:protein-disulfide isomerase